MSLLGTASGLQRTTRCPASNLQEQKPYESEGKESAQRKGNFIHRFLELVVLYSHDEALKWAREQKVHYTWKRIAEGIEVDKLLYGVVEPQAEIAYKYSIDRDEVEILGHLDEARGYGPLAEDEVAGTVDLLDERIGIVADYKTGKTPVPPPRDNDQMLAGAMALTPGGDTLLRIGKIGPKGATENEEDIVTKDDILFYREALRAALGEARRVRDQIEAGETPDVYPHPDLCRYCPAHHVCPAHTDTPKQGGA